MFPKPISWLGMEKLNLTQQNTQWPIKRNAQHKINTKIKPRHPTWKWRGPILVSALQNFSLTYVHTYPLTYSPGTHMRHVKALNRLFFRWSLCLELTPWVYLTSRYRTQRIRDNNFFYCSVGYISTLTFKKTAEGLNRTRHRASTSMYSLTFRVRVATPAQYGRNGKPRCR